MALLGLLGAAIAWVWAKREAAIAAAYKRQSAARAAEAEQRAAEDARRIEPLERLIAGMQRMIDDLRADLERTEQQFAERERALHDQMAVLSAQHGDCLARQAAQQKEIEMLQQEVARLRHGWGMP